MSTLTVSEQGRLIELEGIIANGLKSTLATAKALKEIHDAQLWRSRYRSFDEYCQQRWGIKHSQAYRLLELCEVRDNLSPVGENLPQTERQIRPLAGLPVEKQQEAWTRAVADAGGKQPTGAEVEQAARAARIEELSRKALASMSAEKQLEVVKACEQEILEEDAELDREEEAESREKHLDKARFHLRRAAAILSTLGDDCKAIADAIEPILARAVEAT